MFDLGAWGEILIIVVAALVLIGPKEMPEVLRACGKMVQKLRRLSAGIRQEINKYIHEGEFEEYQKQVNVLGMMSESKKGKNKDQKKQSTKKKKVSKTKKSSTIKKNNSK